MYTLCDNVEGMPPRLYRSPNQILRDIDYVSIRIADISDMLSIHNLLIEMIPEWSESEPEKWIPELEELLDEANEALDTLKELKERLEGLKLEFEDVRCIIRG